MQCSSERHGDRQRSEVCKTVDVDVKYQLVEGVAGRMNEKALYCVEMLLKAAEVVNRRSSGT